MLTATVNQYAQYADDRIFHLLIKEIYYLFSNYAFFYSRSAICLRSIRSGMSKHAGRAINLHSGQHSYIMKNGPRKDKAMPYRMRKNVSVADVKKNAGCIQHTTDNYQQ